MIEQSARLYMELRRVRGTETGTMWERERDRVVSGFKANDHSSPQPLNQTCVGSL
jgi:hypothetical protein